MTKLLLGWKIGEEDVSRIRTRLPECDLLLCKRRPDLQYFECDLPSLRQHLQEAEILMGWIAPRDAIDAAPHLK